MSTGDSAFNVEMTSSLQVCKKIETVVASSNENSMQSWRRLVITLESCRWFRRLSLSLPNVGLNWGRFFNLCDGTGRPAVGEKDGSSTYSPFFVRNFLGLSCLSLFLICVAMRDDILSCWSGFAASTKFASCITGSGSLDDNSPIVALLHVSRCNWRFSCVGKFLSLQILHCRL